jgi:1,4-alpha-glucan branching enzyme
MWRTRDDAAFFPLAEMYFNLFLDTRRLLFDRYHGDLSRPFRELADTGKLEIMTCGATHGFLPLMDLQPEAARAQIRVAARTHERILGRRPRGIWLPECGYAPGVDRYLREEGIRFFLTDSHGIWFGTPRPKYGVFAPVYTPAGVAAFGRDVESSKSVWSAEEGYPGDSNYREFYRDIGFDLDYDYIKPYLNGDGSRVHTGIKYYKITGASQEKRPYNPHVARQKAAEHAGHFVVNRAKQIEHLAGMLDRPPLVVSPYDAELYGHWWFEGPQWLEFMFRKAHADQKVFEIITPAEYLDRHPRNQVVTPSWSSWGYKGYAEVWLNGSNDWIYRHLHKATERMVDTARRYPNAEGAQLRALNQMARELLLAQSSDWAFIMKTGTHVSYAENRTKDHLARFTRLWEDVNNNSVDTPRLESIESIDNPFPDIDYRVYLS